MRNIKKNIFTLVVVVSILSIAPALAQDTYILNPKGPTGSVPFDLVYNLGKDIISTVVKFAVLPFEIITQFIVKSI